MLTNHADWTGPVGTETRDLRSLRRKGGCAVPVPPLRVDPYSATSALPLAPREAEHRFASLVLHTPGTDVSPSYETHRCQAGVGANERWIGGLQPNEAA